MKRVTSYLLCLLLVFGLAACSSSKQEEFNWTREGTFQDENGNYLMIYLSEDIDHPGWSVGLYTEEEMLGWFLMPGEGNTLHGNLVPDYEEGECIVTVSEEGEDGVIVEVEGGETYHFAPMDMPDATIFVSINTEGMGAIDYVEGEETPEHDPEYPFQSAQINIAEPATYTILATPHMGWKFVKWTKNGEDLSTEALLTLELAESADLIAVFEMDEDWVNPLAFLEGDFVCDRANANVSVTDEDVFVTIDWANSATEVARWDIIGQVDPDTLELAFEYCTKRNLVFNDAGEITDETTEYEDGTGAIVFKEDGSGFSWSDDQSGYTDLAFERLPDAE